MSDETSALLGLPYIQAAQAQKHVTHNEALRMLDVLVQASVIGRGLDTPPAAPAEGDRYIVGASPTGDWAGQAQSIALYETGAWQFYAPRQGWQVYVAQDAGTATFDGTAWVTAAAPAELGINTSADTTNRLAVAADATLLTHDGGGHQLKINKAASQETASLVFQSNWSGRAEMGLAGDNAFAIKVSDGTAWHTALAFDPATGLATGDAVQASASDTTPGRLARVDYTYGPGTLLGPVSQAGGLPTGAVIERGGNGNGAYTKFADGTMICTHQIDASAETWQTAQGALFCADTPTSWGFPVAFIDTPSVSVTVQRGDPSAVVGAQTTWANSTSCGVRGWASASLGASDKVLHLTAIGHWI